MRQRVYGILFPDKVDRGIFLNLTVYNIFPMKRMILKGLMGWLCLYSCHYGMAQAGGGAAPAVAGAGSVLVMPGVNLPLDSATRAGLIRSLEGWLRLEADPADS